MFIELTTIKGTKVLVKKDLICEVRENIATERFTYNSVVIVNISSIDSIGRLSDRQDLVMQHKAIYCIDAYQAIKEVL